MVLMLIQLWRQLANIKPALLTSTYKLRKGVDTMLVSCCASVVDGGPVIIHDNVCVWGCEVPFTSESIECHSYVNNKLRT